MEYLFESSSPPESELTFSTSENTANLQSSSSSLLKKKPPPQPRITFTGTTTPRNNGSLQSDRFRDDLDDDYIVSTATMSRPPVGAYNQPRRLHHTNTASGTYKKFPIQPEENIWVKNVNAITTTVASSVNSSSAASSASSHDYSNYNVSEREYVL